MENLPALKKQLSSPKDIIITGHRNPDGDAIGAALALQLFLQKSGHTVRVAMPSEYPYFLSWMKGIDDMLIFDEEPEKVTDYIKAADIVFCLDFNSLERIDKMGLVIGETNVFTAMIDHHPNPEPCADFVLSKTTASSTSELIYDFIELLGEKDKVDVAVADCIMTGILSDTGSFSYGTSPKLFRLTADLMALGVDLQKLQLSVFNNLSEKHLRLLGHCLSNRMEIIPEYQAGIITLTEEDYKRFKISRGDTEGIVNYLLMLKDVKVAAFIHRQPTITKISLRSKGNFSVQGIAKRYFNGGGHINASGGFTYKPLHVAVKRLKTALREYKELRKR